MDLQFIFLLVAVMASTRVCTVHYVTPSIDSKCEDNPCITLTQFAAYSSFYLDTTSTTLMLEPGNHTLSVSLVIGNVMQSVQNIICFSKHISKCYVFSTGKHWLFQYFSGPYPWNKFHWMWWKPIYISGCTCNWEFYFCGSSRLYLDSLQIKHFLILFWTNFGQMAGVVNAHALFT